MAYKLDQVRKLGKSNVNLPILGFGTAPLGGSLAPTSTENGNAALERAWELGVRHFDTAPQYGCGLAEHRVGTALREKPRDKWLLSTKVGRMLRPRRPGSSQSDWIGALPFDIEFDYSFDATLRSLEDSMQRLGIDTIDMVMIHDVSVKWHGTQVGHRFREAMQGAHRALEHLRAEGTIKAFGIGLNDNHTAIRFVEEGDFDYVMIAGRYTLLDLSANQKLLPTCYDKGVAVMMAGPFNSGILATGSVAGAYFQYGRANADIVLKVKKIEAICARHGVPLQAAALQFPLKHAAVTSIVTGFRTAHEIEDAQKCLELQITPEFWDEILSAQLLPEELRSALCSSDQE